MVERLEVEVRALAHLAQRDVVFLGVAVRCLGLRQVGKRDEQLLPPPVELVELRLELLELRLERARLLAQLAELRIVDLARPGGLLDLRGELVLLGSDRVDPRVELTPALVRLDQLVELVGGAPPRQRRADRLGIATDLLQVERGPVPRARARRWSSSRRARAAR
jgi:hypothetical protein